MTIRHDQRRSLWQSQRRADCNLEAVRTTTAVTVNKKVLNQHTVQQHRNLKVHAALTDALLDADGSAEDRWAGDGPGVAKKDCSFNSA
jgi:hypothetical protein